MRRVVLAVVLAAALAAPQGACADAETATGGESGAEPRSRLLPAYRSHFYNYPHELPADYVFRTSRVFAPMSMRGSLLGAAAPAGAQEAGAGQGAELRARIAEFGRALLAGAEGADLEEYVVAVTTFVNLDNLYATSSLGRYLGEQLLGELRRAGIEVVEVRKTPGLLVSRHHGEYALSRDMDELSFVHDVQVLLVGTYTVAGREILVNARLLRNEDNRVLAAATTVLPLASLTADLLADESMPAAAGRTSTVPVRDFEQRGGAPRPSAGR